MIRAAENLSKFRKIIFNPIKIDVAGLVAVEEKPVNGHPMNWPR